MMSVFDILGEIGEGEGGRLRWGARGSREGPRGNVVSLEHCGGGEARGALGQRCGATNR